MQQLDFPRLPDFLELTTTYDPTGKFSNWTSPREVDTGVMRPWVMVAG